MSLPASETAAIVPAAVFVRLKRETNLAAVTQELAGLRFSIILLARWEASRSVDPASMAELRKELAQLRALYFDKIDALAMSFGVQQAMETQRSVERSVVVPKGMVPPLRELRQEQLYF
ncbi:MAG TPA: hypothetical protein VMD55_01965 [Terracidiphilus sp.]|nr:hypothetical protein [Terracidiphilus sp.]